MNENFRILKPFLRGLPLIIGAVLLSVLVARKYLSYTTPMYESTAMLKLAEVNEGMPSSNLLKNFDVFATSNKIATEIEVLRSTSLLEKAISKLDFGTEISRVGDVRNVELYHDAPFRIVSAFNNNKAYNVKYKLQISTDKRFHFSFPDGSQGVDGQIGRPFYFAYGRLLILLNDSLLAARNNLQLADNYEIEFLSRPVLLEKIRRNLDILPVDKDVPVIRISMRSNVPAKAEQLVNTLASSYIYDYIDNKYKAANVTVNFLNDRIHETSEKLMKSETGIESYRNEQSITNIRQETETDLRKISQMKIQQTNLKMSLDAVQELYEYIKSGKNDFLTLAPNFEAFTDLLSTEMVKNIKRLQAEKRDLLLTYTTNDEKAKVIDEKIKDLTDYLAESIHNTLTNQQVKLKILNADIEEAEQVFASVPEKERLLNDMNRDFELLQSSYNFLNEKKIEAEIAQSARIAFHRVITPGEAPIKPVSPVRSIIIIFSGLLGLIGSVTLIYLIHFAKGKVNDIATLEKNSDIPVALCTPKLNTRLETENHFLKEAIQLELKGILKQGVKLAITSYDNTEDHLFHTLQLTTALVAQGRKVLLVDATGTYATTNLPASQVTYLNVSLPHYKTLSRANMLSEIEKAQTGSDVCVIYNQAIAHESIALLLMSIADANLFVMDSRKTAAKKITLITQLSSEFSLPNMWFVLNKAGYNPNVVTQSLRRIKRFYHKIKYARA